MKVSRNYLLNVIAVGLSTIILFSVLLYAARKTCRGTLLAIAYEHHNIQPIQHQLCIPAIRLPNFKDDGQLPAEKRFTLPVTFAREGKMQLAVHLVTGVNAVISELWIWQHD